MKYCSSSQHPNTARRTVFTRQSIILLAMLASLVLSDRVAQASNILLNPGFELSSGAWPPVDPLNWTYYGPGQNYYINSDSYAHSGNNYYKIWGGDFNTGTANVTGVYQDKTSGPGYVYTAEGWFFTLGTDIMGEPNKAWIEVSFLDATNQTLARYRSAEFSASWGENVWANVPVTNVCDVSNNNVVTGSVTQLVAPASVVKVRYQVAHYQINNAGGSVYFDDAVLDQVSGALPPVISSVSPGNLLLVNASNAISFTASSPSGTSITNIQVILNGSNVSTSLVISGSVSNRLVSYSGLQSNQTYSVSIQVTDALGLSTPGSMNFDTWMPLFLWECEDFDFDAGQFIDNPVPTTVEATNSYFGRTGVQDVDENENTGGTADQHLYRPNDPMGTTTSSDIPRQKFIDAQALDYKVGWFEAGEWVNYTRTFPTGTFNIYARVGGGSGAATVTLSKVFSDQTITNLGTFSFVGRGWLTYDSVPLLDSSGNLVAVSLGGISTLRFTTGGGADPTFLMLMPAQLNLPVIGSLFPDGSHPFQPTNTLSFTASSSSTTINDSGIQLALNGVDVSSNLVITGSTSNKNVSYPGLALNTLYTSVIKVTDANLASVSSTNRFDTFNQTNYIVEVEDYDFEGGRFIDHPLLSSVADPADTTNSYFGRSGALDGIDFAHIFIAGEQFQYRPDGIPSQPSSDFVRQKFIDAQVADPAIVDYNLGWFAYPDWCNYTRTYPSGRFLVYGRFAGNGGYSMYLEKVTSGVGTTNQPVQRLGRFGAVGRGWQNYDWVPLMDENLANPVIVELTGISTLRIFTTGNCNPNYWMLVPAPAIGISLSATRSGNNIAISFSTQAGTSYRVLYRDDLTTGNWTLLTTVAGNGSIQSMSDPLTGAKRFYQVATP
jgi:hypothetical protein